MTKTHAVRFKFMCFHALPFPDGQEQVVMRTPVNDIQLAFTPGEWDDFHEAMEEAVYMQEVYSLIERDQ